jgi:hypothetical protein
MIFRRLHVSPGTECYRIALRDVAVCHSRRIAIVTETNAEARFDTMTAGLLRREALRCAVPPKN